MPIPIAIQPIIYAAGSGGAPSTASELDDLRGRMTSYQHTISAAFGFESCTIAFPATADEALYWMDQLMASVIVLGPEGEIIWEGFLNSVAATFGQEERTLSLDGMANRVRTRYTTVLGTQGVTATVSDTASISRYGTKDMVLTLPTTDSAGATGYRDSMLARSKRPTASISTRAQSGALGDVQITLGFVGWYDTLSWIVAARTDTTAEETSEQVEDLISTSSPGIGTTNNFLNTSTTYIESTGVSVPRLIEPDTTYREKIEQLLAVGNSNAQRLAWGVYEGRTFVVKEWAGAEPDTVTYYRRLGSGTIEDVSNNIVLPWNVRPDAMLQVPDLLDPAPSPTADAISRFYVQRVTCDVSSSGIGVTLEPADNQALDAALASFATRKYA